MLRARQVLGKYRIEKRLGTGGFALVYQAFDTIEGISVALKIPHEHHVNKDMLSWFRHEVRVAAKLDHPNILPIKNASFVGEKFVIATPLASGTLDDRLKRRMSLKNGLWIVEQALEALAHAHRHGIIHCDVKPDNILMFDANTVRLADFGIAKIALKTVKASGSGTVGYMAPEQAMGRPSPRSDVFSIGLIMFRLFSGELPEWPYAWPPKGFDRLRRTLHPDLIEMIRRSIEVDQTKRFADAGQMLAAFRRLKLRAMTFAARRRMPKTAPRRADWKTVRLRQFRRDFGKALGTEAECLECGAPTSEPMRFCPWCSARRSEHVGETSFPAQCPRCQRGVKLDWRFCAWCHGASIGPMGARNYGDARYQPEACENARCERKEQLPFTHYCPWCGRKSAKSWDLDGSEDHCHRCGWGTADEYWDYCPWCGAPRRS